MKLFRILFLKGFEPIWIKCTRLDINDLHHNFVTEEDGLVVKIEQINNNNILRVREEKL